MTDRELLELATRAAGIKALRSPDGILRDCTGGHPSQNIFSAPAWNPLTDDGDALRLAVKLRIHPIFTYGGLTIGAQCTDKLFSAVYENTNDDPYAATRRAIVRAAAEIGVEE